MKILIVRPDGIGDLVVSLPIATQIRQQLPDAKIGFLVNAITAPILTNHPDVDFVKIIKLDAPLRERMQAFSKDIEAVIFLKPFKELMWPAFLAQTPIRIATGYRLRSLLANRRIYEHRSDCSKHEAEYNLSLLKGLGLTPSNLIPPQLAMTVSELNTGEKYWKTTHKPRIIIHPGGISSRHWRSIHYQNLALNLSLQGYSVILTGSKQERIDFEKESFTENTTSPDITNLMGQLSLRDLMSVIATSQVVVSASTGPAHLAGALGAATVSLFDPRRSSLPERWKPLGQGILLSPEVPTCEKCIGEACPYWDCLDRIKVTEVAYQITQLIANRHLQTELKIIHL
jgi:heptosyltransferase-2